MLTLQVWVGSDGYGRQLSVHVLSVPITTSQRSHHHLQTGVQLALPALPFHLSACVAIKYNFITNWITSKATVVSTTRPWQHAVGHLTTPLPFGRICFVVLGKGGESSWSAPWHLRCTSEVFHVHSYQDQFTQPGWAECVFFIFSLGLSFCIALICLCVPILLCFPGQLSHLPYRFWRWHN